MNIKSYTDLEQSKKLVEILPLESADMYYWWKGQKVGVGHSKELQEGFESRGIEYIPAWSLSALFSVLPRIDIEKEICSNDTYDYRVKAYIGDGYIGDWFDNPVDACYEMLVKLKERNLL